MGKKFKEFFGMVPPEADPFDEPYMADEQYDEQYAEYPYDGGHYDDKYGIPGATPLPPLSSNRYGGSDLGEPSGRHYAPREAAQITTLCPKSYADAEHVGKAFRNGNPVVIDLTRVDNEVAQRLVDFASGSAFALHGSLQRIARKVILITPADAHVDEDEKRRISESYDSQA